jgi:hypothetical protein
MIKHIYELVVFFITAGFADIGIAAAPTWSDSFQYSAFEHRISVRASRATFFVFILRPARI